MRGLFWLFFLVPLLEMWLLIKVGQEIGAWQTIGLVVLTAMIGIHMLKQQGLKTLWRVQERMEAGQLPATEIIEGVLLAVGGALLLTPGFVTDAFGFVCLIPGTRRRLVGKLVQHGVWMGVQAAGRMKTDAFQQNEFYQQSFRQEHKVHPSDTSDRENRREHTIIDGEFDRLDK